MRWSPYPCPPAHDWNTYVSDLVFAKITMTEEVMLRSFQVRHGGSIRWSVQFKSIRFYCSELGNLAIFTVRLYEILDCVREINSFIHLFWDCLFVCIFNPFFLSILSIFLIFLLAFFWLVQSDATEEEKWDLLEGPKGRSGWGHHPYTLLTAIFTIWDKIDITQFDKF